MPFNASFISTLNAALFVGFWRTVQAFNALSKTAHKVYLLFLQLPATQAYTPCY